MTDRSPEALRSWAQGRLDAAPLYGLLGIALDDVDRGRVAASLLVRAEHCNIDGVVHGGLYTLLADTALGIAARTMHAPDAALKTLELATSFLDGVRKGERLVVCASVVRATGRLVWCEAVMAATGTDGPEREVARARSLNYVVPATGAPTTPPAGAPTTPPAAR